MRNIFTRQAVMNKIFKFIRRKIDIPELANEVEKLIESGPVDENGEPFFIDRKLNPLSKLVWQMFPDAQCMVKSIGANCYIVDEKVAEIFGDGRLWDKGDNFITAEIYLPMTRWQESRITRSEIEKNG